LLSEFPGAYQIASAHLTHLKTVLSDASNGRYDRDKAIEIRKAARTSIGAKMPAKSLELKHTIQLIRILDNEIASVGAIAPGVVAVGTDKRHAICALSQNRNHITLNIGNIVICCVTTSKRQRRSAGIIGKCEGSTALFHLHQLRAVVDVAIGIGSGSIAAAGTHTTCIIGVIPGSRALG